MIWIHTYGVGPFKKKVLRNIHESEESALASQKVLGGTVQCYMKKPQGFDLVVTKGGHSQYQGTDQEVTKVKKKKKKKNLI